MQAFRDQMDEVVHNLKFSLDPLQITMFSEFFENIQLRTKLIEAQVQVITYKMKESFHKLSHEIVSLETRNSPFRRAIDATYAPVMAAHPPKSGKVGIHNSRRMAFKQAVTSKTKGPYMAIKTHFETRVKTILQDAETEPKTRCDDLFVKVFRDRVMMDFRRWRGARSCRRSSRRPRRSWRAQ
jgi:hypothetical protein